MTQEDSRDEQRRDAHRHALLVEGVAMAVRATPEALMRYAADYRKADWLHAGTAPPAAPAKPTPDILTNPWFAGIVAAAGGPSPATPAPPAVPTIPVYRVRKDPDAR